MSNWIRIDDDTYIDDSLVTCAEYQLFIDEMREKGQFYQPDHWASYQFPKGQACEPILGIRRTDAWNFCRWLNNQKLIKREDGIWNYRLPSIEETDFCHLKPTKNLSPGYWTNHPKHSFINWGDLFSWDFFPINARLLSSDAIPFSDLSNILAQYPSLDFPSILNHSMNRPFDFPFDLSYQSWHYHERSMVQFDTIDDELELYLDRNLANRRSSNAIDCILNKILVIPEGTHINFLENLLEAYIDVLTLKERIAGRSPAFEGIRIVKERID